MAKKEQFNLNGFEEVSPGVFKKTKTVPQPREINIDKSKIDWNKPMSIERQNVRVTGSVIKSIPPKRKLTLTLFGEPMPKQSVRGYATGRKNANGILIVDHFQPQKTTDRKNDYIRQIKEQLPKDFIPFMVEVFVTKFHCIYPPLKAFHTKKGKMDAIRNGEIFYKNTQPYLIDNLKKLVFDCLGKDKKTKTPLVLGNDGIIVGEDNTRKYYGIGGCIILELKGY